MFPSAVTALTGAGRSRSPERAGRERACLGEREADERASERAGRRGPSARWPGEGGGLDGAGGGEAAPGVRGFAEGAESSRATPSPAGKTRAWGGRSGGLPDGASEGGGARPGEPRKALRSETQARRRNGKKRPRGTGSTRSGGCGGGLGDRGGATPRGVQLVESEGRSESERASETRARLWSAGSGKKPGPA